MPYINNVLDTFAKQKPDFIDQQLNRLLEQ
jgi:hypothetical protein